jgi:hypothetical protein
MNWIKKHKVWSAIIGLFIVGSVMSAGGGGNTTNNTNNTSDNKAPQKTEEKKAEDNVPAEYKAALAKAKQYADTMRMSKQGVYDQLTSNFGEKFTPEAAKYAVDNVKADWNANALAKAKEYQKTMHMSPAAIRDQLVSPNGEKFTEAEADYAIAHLND